jgi:hypothetical protein
MRPNSQTDIQVFRSSFLLYHLSFSTFRNFDNFALLEIRDRLHFISSINRILINRPPITRNEMALESSSRDSYGQYGSHNRSKDQVLCIIIRSAAGSQHNHACLHDVLSTFPGRVPNSTPNNPTMTSKKHEIPLPSKFHGRSTLDGLHTRLQLPSIRSFLGNLAGTSH